MFLRLYEKKSKLRYLFRKGHDKNEIQKEVSSCVEQRYNGFHITEHMCEKKRQIDFVSVDIVCEPVWMKLLNAISLRLQDHKNSLLRCSKLLCAIIVICTARQKRCLKSICVSAQKNLE